jgi:hypothetical protein
LVFDHGQWLVFVLNVDFILFFEVLLEADIFVVFAFEG